AADGSLVAPFTARHVGAARLVRSRIGHGAAPRRTPRVVRRAGQSPPDHGVRVARRERPSHRRSVRRRAGLVSRHVRRARSRAAPGARSHRRGADAGRLVTAHDVGMLVLLGHPVRQSVSPIFQNAALRAAGLALTYEALDVEPGALGDRVRALVARRAAGNVTIPHKLAVAGMCETLTPLAQRAGAVNTFWVEQGALAGDNTDVGGFDELARRVLGSIPLGARVALLGAGGAAAAVLTAVERWPGA